MAAYIERRYAYSAGWCRRISVFSAVLFVVGGVSHRYGFLETTGFFWILGLVGLLALVALGFGAAAFSRIWNRGDTGTGQLVWGTLVALVILVPFTLSAYRGFVYPNLNDVSTDLDDPPALTAAIAARTADMNVVSNPTPERRKLQAAAYPLVTGRRYTLPYERVLTTVQGVMKQNGWRIKTPGQPLDNAVETTIEATAYTLLLAFPIDVAVRVTDEGSSTYVDMRSASQYGRRDLGDNANRVAGFLAELDMAVALQAGIVAPE